VAYKLAILVSDSECTSFKMRLTIPVSAVEALNDSNQPTLRERIERGDPLSAEYLRHTLYSVAIGVGKPLEKIEIDHNILKALDLMLSSKNFMEALYARGVDVKRVTRESLLTTIVFRNYCFDQVSERQALSVIEKF